MATNETNMLNSGSTYSGLDSFGDNTYERELELCRQFGADVEKLKALKFNSLQLAEIRKGIADKVDVSKYMDPSLSWSAMEEIRLEMYSGIDMSSYRKQGFDVLQLAQIRQGIAAGIDVSVYAKKEYFADQMRELRLGLSKEGGVPIVFYQDPAFDSMQMREIRKGLENGLDISMYAHPHVPFLKMRVVRLAAQDGLKFDKAVFERYNANILDQMHKAFLDKIDINKYVRERFDDEQLEQVRLAIKEGLPIDDYITGDMRGDAIKEIRLGLENGVDVKQYADVAYGWQQMYEMRMGLEHQIDITPYRKPLYQADQMREIRLGIEASLDISKYSTMMYTARDMRRIRRKLESGAYDIEKSIAAENGAAAGYTPTEDTSEIDAFVKEMILHKETYLAYEENNMKCFLSLPDRLDGKKYTEEIILKFLEKANIIYGVDKEAVKRIGSAGRSVIRELVASGKPVVNGANGHYTFYFNTEITEEPELLKDGTVNLDNIEYIQSVKVGDKIAEYHRASKGVDGYDVFGTFLKAMPGKEIPILKGTGFMILNDRVSYVATYSGAIRMVDGKVEITKLLVTEEVKITDKAIKYDGTVYVKGDVFSGSVIDATGDVIIGGHLESSDVNAGGNVVIKGGVTCPIRGSIYAGGDITAKYFEGATIVGKDIVANYFINCKVESKGMVKTLGRAGMIYGGTINSLFGIEAASVGNKAGAKTIINIGVNSNVLSRYNQTKKNISRETEQLETLNKEKERLKEVGGGDRQLMQWKVKINAAVATKETRIKELEKELLSLEVEIGKGNSAEAVITETAYANAIFVIAGIIYKFDTDRKTYDKMIIKADGARENIVII
ncbi:DUF342 domain-containing protein [Butyrivibrio sp. CB08]|uniref:DUF342 domain-containing protein n=1 Tax=Butyrivibrio sp. CB08 TaxID=2364879 RepID=UPI000EA9DC66|nr:FapA family protein [Butyrivibrio sp. CB08]RKM61025.1 DUF342 domain-containing protein [Butyrivibrio sp. CB08]